MLYYMMLLAITALLSFPLVISQRFSKSRITITRNLFSCKRSTRKKQNLSASHCSYINISEGLKDQYFQKHFLDARKKGQNNVRTCSSTIEPDIDPIAQHRVLRLFQLQSSPFNCLLCPSHLLFQKPPVPAMKL